MPEIFLPETGRPYVLIVAAPGESDLTAVPSRTIVDLYRHHGAIMLRGFDVDLDAFRAFAAQFCVSSVFNESPDRKLLDEAHNIQSVNGGAAPFPLHPELSRTPWKPDVCFFCCLSPPREQGATTICDGIALAEALPPAVREGLLRQRLLYIQPAPPEVLEFWLGVRTPGDSELASPPPGCPYSFHRVGGQILRAFSRPALHKPMFAPGPAFGNFLLFARYHNGRADFPSLANGSPVPPDWVEAAKHAGDRLSVAIAWRKGDLLMLDNTRFMHGRTAIVDPDERLIASYFGYLNFAVPDPEEPSDPIWRRVNFRPPAPRLPPRPQAH